MNLLKLTNEEFQKMAALVYDRTGIHLPIEKLSLLSNRLRKRLKALELESFAAYYDLLLDKKGCEEELPHFLSAVTTNETYFFRNEQLWNFIGGDFIKHIVESKKAGNKTVRVWSAASSSGEEAYTTSIVLREHLPNFATWNVTIIGSDISSRVLEKARGGVYDAYAVSRMPPALLKKWFKSDANTHTIRDEIKKLVRFQHHNLRDPFPNGRFDLVFLRNVLMYFDLDMKKRVIKHVSDALTPGGHLIVGDVDPIRTIPELSAANPCEYQRPGVYRKPGGKVANIGNQRMATT